LLERSGQLKRTLGNGSVTSFPIIETKGGDITSYIPTNVISITDGQIFLSKTILNRSLRPAIDITVSVSRIGSKAQYSCLKYVCKKVRNDYATFKSFENVAKVSSDLDQVTELYINRGLAIIQFLNQPLYHTYTLYNEVLGFFLLSEGYVDGIKTKYVNLYFNILFKAFFINMYLYSEKKLLKYVKTENSSVVESLLKMYSIEPFLNDLHLLGNKYHNFFKSEIQSVLIRSTTTIYYKHLYNISKPII
jgi:F0F1-type ATP synthase alpha subunit